MCGLFGWLKFEGVLTDREIEMARSATAKLAHRGPDASGYWSHRGVFMAHQRLKILDLSENAAQPFKSDDNRYILTYNGEIYNYIELREELKQLGFVFTTESDTEVFLKSYQAWGIEAFERFEGMFACAIHDNQTDTHILVRDHLGQKPLYYFEHGQELVYASELRALLALECLDWSIDRENFTRYLANSYYVWDTSPIKGVKKLLPGCFVEFKNGRTQLKRYWDSVPGDNQLDLTLDEASEQFTDLFDRNCQISMRSDVPYGVLLSGGVDSSLILQACHKHNPNITAYSVAMGETDFDESAKAREICRHLGIKNHQVYTLGKETLYGAFRDYLGALDEPHGDPGFVNMRFLAQSCRKDITVALAGDGGDELFAGYAPFSGLGLASLIQTLPSSVLDLINWGTKNFLKSSDGYLGLQFKALAYLQGFPANSILRYPLWLASMAPEDLARLCPNTPQDFFDRSGQPGTLLDFAANCMKGMESKTPTQQLLYFYQKIFLPEFVCLHTDRASMQSSFEVRSPFLTISMIKFANRLPDGLKWQSGESKRLLKTTMARCGFSDPILKQKKQGFTFPIARWLKTDLRQWLDNLAEDEALEDLVDRKVLKALIASHLSGKRNNYRILFNLIAFQAWRKNFPEVR
ncbi:MAG: asparagine synthase (glutamine-hydrolyzing) [Nitrospina sp.]|jgi:asparagine synthase (glutamine-hydrolysing)|nr:asparagine synthase (glutamine-hydrolyzing) [Nitrospina sp.]